MLKLAYSSVLAAAAVSYVSAQSFVSDPLVDKVVPYTAIPYQVDQHTADRGPQSGYNICNSTTETQDSMCQTGFMNHIDDFCLFAPPKPNTTIGDSEGEEVAWCTKKGHGSRLIPEGALYGVQVVQSPGYIQIVGFIDQTKLNIADGDYGGELDSGGQDGRGNPIGGLVYSNAFPSNNGDNSSYQQSRHWTYFIGGNTFCAKACDDTQPNAAALCEHIYDRIGCAYNAPSNAKNGTFEYCKGDDMVPVGQYVVNGVTSTWTQPAETVSITGVPYTPTPAASSQCTTFTSASLYTDLASVGVSGSPANPSATGSSGSGSGASTTKSGSSPSQTGNSNSAGTAMGLSIVSGFAGVLFSVFAFAA
ncbi:hypothetical protein GYMLUDRAFT_900013 [Collybiopsis luxurians FD-317 M1]|uniref:Macrofage activating glycoprotein n=1 Tax=Collybiopsis luxurians FD-317 M1 TaxID=944289 RepID=A0A0D0BI88_9AGAR|nr:hypothetical protein GYMLUDRAFT_900013 [Collybiopsis luxurians FD-317 M1]